MYSEQEIYTLLEKVPDPEIPVLTINDLGIIRNVQIVGEDAVLISITPTYTGCPAMDMIAMQIKMELMAAGIKNVLVHQIISPPWSTDYISKEGKRKLKEYGIAPPHYSKSGELEVLEDTKVNCPRCDSEDTRLISQFGSTACKALFQCNQCLEPFDYFKCH